MNYRMVTDGRKCLLIVKQHGMIRLVRPHYYKMINSGKVNLHLC